MPVVVTVKQRTLCVQEQAMSRVDGGLVRFCARHASRPGFSAIKARHTKPYLAKTHIADDIQASRAHKPQARTEVGAATRGLALRRRSRRGDRYCGVRPARGDRSIPPRRPLPAETAPRARGCPQTWGAPGAAAERTPPPRGAGRRKQRKPWRPPSSRSARRRRRVRASSRSASGLMQKKQNNKEKGGARPSRPGPRI